MKGCSRVLPNPGNSNHIGLWFVIACVPCEVPWVTTTPSVIPIMYEYVYSLWIKKQNYAYNNNNVKGRSILLPHYSNWKFKSYLIFLQNDSTFDKIIGNRRLILSSVLHYSLGWTFTFVYELRRRPGFVFKNICFKLQFYHFAINFN